jgi:predicted dehydrogenase
MNDRIRWGVISTANIGKKRVIPAIQKSNNGDMVAVASRSIGKAKAFAEEMGIPIAYGSYEDLINDPNIDAIYNPLPNSAHAEWSIKCAKAGKPVLCEKPLASDVDEAQKMVDVFAEQKVLFAEAFMYRFHPQTQRVKAMLRDGAIGEVQLIKASFTFPVGNENDVRLQASLAGGGVKDVGCYCINIMRFLTDEEPISARALARFGGETGVDEALIGILSFPSGVLGHFDCGLRQYREDSYEIRGTKGRIVVPMAFGVPTDEDLTFHWYNEEGESDITIYASDHYTLMVEDFADALLHNRPPRFHPQDGVENMRVVDALLESAQNL